MGVPFNKILVLDYETRYSQKPQEWCPDGYTLRKMTTEEYVRSPMFQDFGASIKEFKPDSAVAQWYRPDELRKVFKTYDWSKTAVVCHNAAFDASILAWHYGIQPAFIFDTLSMSRALRGTRGKNSLAALAKDFGLPDKGTAIGLSDGLYELSPSIERLLAEYCNHDVWLCEEVFKRFLMMVASPLDIARAEEHLYEYDFNDAYHMESWDYPIKELRLIDMTLRMFTRPLLQLDSEMLVDALEEEKDTREKLLTRLGISDSDLASNDRFADILRGLGVDPPMKKKNPTAKTPNPVGFNYAFAKNDAGFLALQAHEDDNVVTLCEARLKVKSTTERTRAQRFVDISHRGALPVPLHYYGALTGRWAAAKGEAINMQNLKRGSFLRKAIMAPEGCVIVVVDLSQIEPRVLAWLADYDDLLDIFRSGKDAYAMFGSQMFNVPGMTKESDPMLRQSAKSALLGCFGADTLVLTRRGWVDIVSVQATDTVWDGEEWVHHQGVLAQGEKEVLTAHGVSVTSDHEILTEHGWAAWSEVLANPSLLKSALSSASSPVSVGSESSTSAGAAATTPVCDALADGKGLCTEATSHGGQRPVATTAPNARQSKLDGRRKAILQFAQTVRTAIDFLTASVQSLFAAPTLKARSTLTTGGAGLPSTLPGSKTASSFSDISSGLMGGTNRSCNSTVRTTPRGTFPGTCALSHEASTWPTNAALRPEKSSNCASASQPLKQRMQTYDIAFAGPRNRYTVWTDKGPLTVHNCGYGLGWASFAAQLLVGFLGAPPVRYDMAFAKKLGVDGKYVERFLDWDDNVKAMADIPHNCTMQELLIHCVAAKKIIDIYRATASPVKGFWDMCTELIHTALAEGQEYNHKGALLFRKEEILLPNGMSIRYPNLRQVDDEDALKEGKRRKQWVYGDGAETTKLYAGKVTNNVTQSLARIVMTDGLLKVSTRIPLVGTVHDEGLGIVKKEEGEKALGWMIRRMTEEPRYMPGIPLAADGGVHRRYGTAKN